jgi:hypothetical protein
MSPNCSMSQYKNEMIRKGINRNNTICVLVSLFLTTNEVAYGREYEKCVGFCDIVLYESLDLVPINISLKHSKSVLGGFIHIHRAYTNPTGPMTFQYR